MLQSKIVVLGSINIDLVASCKRLPVPGETLTATDYVEVFGGKGANQAVGAARAGGKVSMIGRVGDDVFASRLKHNLQQHGIDTTAVNTTIACSSGLAMIIVDASGENQIVVIPGSNGRLTCDDVDRHVEAIANCDCLLLQMEVPLPTVVHAIQLAKKLGVRVILDPAPVPSGQLPCELFSVDLICPNESEAARLTGVPNESLACMEEAAHSLYERGARSVAITLGDQGTLFFDGTALRIIESVTVDAVDTTGAGDAFAGALAVRWAETDDLLNSIRWANIAGALAASRHGAQSGIASRCDIDNLFSSLNS